MHLWEHQSDSSIFTSFRVISWNLSAILVDVFSYLSGNSFIWHRLTPKVSTARRIAAVWLCSEDILEPWGLQIALCSFLSLCFYPVLVLEGTVTRKLIANSTECQRFQPVETQASFHALGDISPTRALSRSVPLHRLQLLLRHPHSLSLPHRELLGFLSMLQMLG